MNKVRELGEGCRLIYRRASECGRNGVDIILSGDIKARLVSVSKRSDRVMSIKLGLEDIIVNILSVYAPQIGCDEEE